MLRLNNEMFAKLRVNKKLIPLNSEQEKKYNTATNCYYCNKSLRNVLIKY